MADKNSDSQHVSVSFAINGKATREFCQDDIVGENYRLITLLGRGGMGFVFRAEHTIMGRQFALKVLDPAQVNEVSWNRFQSEGRAIARLDHPNIVKIYNMGVDRGDCPYYVMDLLDGMTLHDCIEDGMALTMDEVVDIFIQLAAGFAYAHEHGIVHRDVKPANIVLIDSGKKYPTAKIVDFGIAKLTGAADQIQQSLTATGEICGSPLYMSPEQCMGSDIDQRSDIYSLGCTLFEALTGNPPFRGESALVTVMMHQNKPAPSLSQATGEMWSAELEAIIAKMLMKRPADRYQSMRQLGHDLERIRANKSVGKNVNTGFRFSAETQLEDIGSRYEAQQHSWLRDKRLLGAVALTVVVLGGAIALYTFGQSRVRAKKMSANFPAFSSPVQDMAAENAAGLLNKQIKSAAAKFSGITSLAGSLSPDKSKLIFHFPPFTMGRIVWWLGKVNVAGLDATNIDDAKIDARGTVTVPADKPLIFSVDVARHSDTWLYPQILSKFGANDFKGFAISAMITPSIGSDAELHGVEKLVLNNMVSLRSWKNLQFLELYNMPVTNDVLAEIAFHSRLEQLIIRDTTVDPVQLGETIKKLPHIRNLQLTEISSLDQLCFALKNSKTIASIEVQDCEVSAPALEALTNCPELRLIELSGVQMDKGQLEALTKIKSLKGLTLMRDHLLPNQIATLAKLKFVPMIRLDVQNWPAPAIATLQKDLPQAALFNNSGRQPE